MKENFESYIGRKFGKWTVEKYSHIISYNTAKGWVQKSHYFLCRCECGKKKSVALANLKSGRSTACRNCGKLNPNAISYHPLRRTWYGMLSRCYNSKDEGYKNYGERGIKICDRWLGENGFNNFVTDIGERPSNLHSIDRINNDGDYSPENCRWATSKEQMNNTRLTGKLTQINLAKSVGLTREAIRQFYNAGRFPLELIEGYTVTNKPIFKPETIEYIRQGKHLQSYIKQIAV